MCPPYPQRDRKRRLNGAVCRNHRIKRLVPCRCLNGHVKEPYEMSMSLGAWPYVQLLLQSACTSTSMCRHLCDWNIVNLDIKQLIHSLTHSLKVMLFHLFANLEIRLWVFSFLHNSTLFNNGLNHTQHVIDTDPLTCS